MKKFQVKFLREFEVEIEAEDSASAQKLAAQFPADTCKLLSIIAEDASEQPCQACLEFGPIREGEKTPPRGGKPNGGGSPGTPVVRAPVELVDQIAEAA